MLLAARAVLQLLREGGPQTVPALARSRNTTRQNIQIIVDRLQTLGCVETRVNPNHKRSSLIDLTEKGRSLLEASEGQEGRLLQTLAARFSEDETAQALESVRRVAVAVDETRNAAAANPLENEKPVLARVRTSKRPVGQPKEPISQDVPDRDLPEEGLPVNLL